MRRFSFSTLFAVLFLTIGTFTLSSCWEEQHPGTYYTFTGQTIASDLAGKPEYSDFVRVLERAGMWNNLITYGKNTCFAPDNNAIALFLKQREAFANAVRVQEGLEPNVVYNSVEDLPKADCDTLAWTHLLDITCFINDLDPGLLPKVNLNDRYLILTLDSTHVAQFGDSVVALQRRINNAIVVAIDDSCENGVVHYLDRCLDFGGNYVYDLVDNDPNTQLFAEAVRLCKLRSVLSEWYDNSYKIGEDSVLKGVELNQAGSNVWHVHYWEKRKTCFTLLVEPDSIYKANGINNVIPDMFNLAKQIYPEFNDVDSIMSDYSCPQNPLYKYISYHILPFLMDISRINGRADVMKTHHSGELNPEDYFETLLPRSLMRISTKSSGRVLDPSQVYINSRGKEGNGTTSFAGAKVRGIKILTAQEMLGHGVTTYNALNGVYHYIDGILKYDTDVREDILDRRIRIDCSTLSPDFITSGGRQFDNSTTGDSKWSYGFKNPKNFASYHQDYTMQVRAASGGGSYAYEGDGVDIQGQFDMYVKLPPVPHDGTWQLRLSFRANSHCGIIQNYIACVPSGQEVQRTDWTPLGIPVDLRVNLTDPKVGWVKDSNLDGDAEILALDKSMKNRGWMKGSKVNTTSDDKLHRDVDTMGRIILMNDYLKSNMDYYIRIKQLLEDTKAEFLFDYMEWVPKSVYDNDEDMN